MNVYVETLDEHRRTICGLVYSPLRAALTAGTYVWRSGTIAPGVVEFNPHDGPADSYTDDPAPEYEEFVLEAIGHLLATSTDGVLLKDLLVLLQKYEGEAP